VRVGQVGFEGVFVFVAFLAKIEVEAVFALEVVEVVNFNETGVALLGGASPGSLVRALPELTGSMTMSIL